MSAYNWKPKDYDKDPITNAILNLAAETHSQAEAIGSLLYALKYSKNEGLSVAEALTKLADSIESAVSKDHT